jgi:radical SAM superfamily enzyme YgiQ (UPF0313 family)
MRILLIEPPWAEVYNTYRSMAKIGTSYPPLGLCYLSSVLMKAGHTTKIIDVEIEGKNLGDILSDAKAFRPDLVAITSTTPIFHRARQIAGALKKSLGVPIVIGGPHITALPRESFEGARDLFDYGVRGEGEETILLLCEGLSDPSRLSKIGGLIWWNGREELILNPDNWSVPNLNSLPWPDRKDLKMDRYLWSIPGKGTRQFATIITARGCPFKCIFCSAPKVFGNYVRFRDIQDVLDELEWMLKNLKADHVIFLDDTFTLKRERVEALCEGILSRGLKFTWEGWTRANTVDEGLLRRMRDAGLIRISFGIESGNPDMLKKIKKDINLQDIRRAYSIAKKLGLETKGSVMLGHPYETRRTLEDTLRFINSLKGCDHMHIGITTPYPGTELYDMVRTGEGGIRLLTEDFSEFKRYGDAVIEVNDLSRRDLVRFQKKAFKMFYLTPGRIWYNFRRAGLRSAFKNIKAFVDSVFLNK